MKATIHDVATEANVSIATVSRVLNGTGTVKENTRLRVQKAIEKVGYQGGQTADQERADKESVGKMLLVLAPSLETPFYNSIYDGIETAAMFQGYDFVLYKMKESQYSLEKLNNLAKALNVCGIISLGKIASAADLNQLDQLFPVVQCAEYDEECDLPYVSIDDYSASKAAVNYLIQNGYHRIALCNGTMSFKYAAERERGYYDALREAGLKIDEKLIVNQPDLSFEPAVAVLSRIITKRSYPDAVFAVSDVLAAAAIKAANRAGLRVPEDIAVVGFDDTYVARISTPSLTVIRQPAFQIGSQACKMLLDRINGINISHKQILMDVDFIVRESTAKKATNQ